MAAAVIETGGGNREYLDRLRAEPVAEVLGAAAGDPYERGGVEAAITLAINHAEERHPLAREVMELLAVLSPIGVDRALLIGDRSDAAAQAGVRDALAILVAGSLLAPSRDRQAVVMHRLTARVVREGALQAGRLAERMNTAVALVDRQFAPVAGVWDERHKAGPLVDHTEVLLGLVTGFNKPGGSNRAWRNRPELGGRIVDLAGRAVRHLLDVHDSARAIPLGHTVTDHCSGLDGSDHPDTLRSRNNVANVYGEVGRMDEAIGLYQQALEAGRSSLNPEHPVLRAVEANLARALAERNQE